MSGNNGAKLHNALRHPLRRQIMREIRDKDSVSPRETAESLGQPLSNVSYHFRVLADCDAVGLVDTQQKRGSIAHFYKLTVDEPWVLAALDADEDDGNHTTEV